MQGKDVAEPDNLKIYIYELPLKLACTMTEEVIPMTSIKNGPVKKYERQTR